MYIRLIVKNEYIYRAAQKVKDRGRRKKENNVEEWSYMPVGVQFDNWKLSNAASVPY